MTQPDEVALRRALDTVPVPDELGAAGGAGLDGAGLISGLKIKQGRVAFMLQVPPDLGAKAEDLRQRAEAALRDLPGVSEVTGVLTSGRPAGAARPASPAGPASAPGRTRQPPQGGQGARRAPGPMAPEVRHIIAVASAKGGVGKSTVAVNLALGLREAGLSVGLLDADIYGPSLPMLTGLTGRQPRQAEGQILPLTAHGLTCMSIGFLVDAATPMVWRGPMVQSALQQMLADVRWGPLDVLVVDMPPGTGDAQLTMAQQVPLAGAVIVSTPQDLALADARKGMAMFAKVEVPVLGIIENMSTFTCPHCGGESHIFGHGGARAEAERAGTACLAEIPLAMEIRELSDSGTPILAARPDSPRAAAFRDAAFAVAERLGGRDSPAAPKIVIE